MASQSAVPMGASPADVAASRVAKEATKLTPLNAPTQRPDGLRIDEHFDVGVGVVDEDDLRVRRSHGLDRDAVVLLLVDELDAVADAGGGVTEIGAVVQQHWAIADEVAGRPQRTRQLAGRPNEHLILRGKD